MLRCYLLELLGVCKWGSSTFEGNTGVRRAWARGINTCAKSAPTKTATIQRYIAFRLFSKQFLNFDLWVSDDLLLVKYHDLMMKVMKDIVLYPKELVLVPDDSDDMMVFQHLFLIN